MTPTRLTLIAGVALTFGLLMAARMWWVAEFDGAVGELKTDQGVSAIARLERLGHFGSKQASELVGYSYALGWAGLPINRAKAVEWTNRAERGCRHSRHGCGDIEDAIARDYRDGEEGAHRDADEDRFWSIRAADVRQRK
jgi:hypothetical protein